MLAFVVSLGMGDEVSIAGIKLSYITLIAIVAGLFVEAIFDFKSEIKRFFSQKFIWFSIIWAIYGIIQRYWVIDMDLWHTYYRSLIINLIVIAILLFYIKTWEDWKWIGISFFAELIMYLAIGAWEMITANHIVSGDIVMATKRTPVVFWVNENDAGVMFSILLASALILFFLRKRKRVFNIIFAAIVLLTLVEIYFTHGRGSIIGLLLLLVFSVYFYWLSGIEAKDKKKGTIILVSCVAAVIVIATAFLIAHPASWYIKHYAAGEDGLMESDMFRVRIIVDNFHNLLKSHLLGIGPGQLVATIGMPIHFFYLEILYEHGIFMGGYMLFLFFRIGFKYEKHVPRLSGSIVRAVPFALIMLGVSTSKMFLMRPVWVLFVLLYTFKNCDELEAEPKNIGRVA